MPIRTQTSAQTYAQPVNSILDRFGRRTIDRLDLRPGARVLNVGHETDTTSLAPFESQFDAVICAFGIPLASDIGATAQDLWRSVRPGGILAITAWGRHLFEPASSWLWSAIRTIRPDLYSDAHQWNRTLSAEDLVTQLADAGITSCQVVEERSEYPISSVDCWWSAVMSSSYRWILEQLDPADYSYVRSATWHNIHYSGIGSVEVNVLYATASKSEVNQPLDMLPPYAGGRGLADQATRLFI